ncbi:MAG: site-specific integrase, partial [Flavobacteriaceae bacterium]|nr:site-specific integrase [Flavobacteriaceae bacterium]
MNWTHALADYKHYLKIERGLASNTIDNYIFDVKKLVKYLEDIGSSANPDSISSEAIQQCIYQLSKSLNARSQSRIISGLRSFFDYLVFENIRRDNPMD